MNYLIIIPNMVLNNHTKNDILKHLKNNHVQLTYLAIGSANNREQQLPNFILNYGLNTRIIIIDPCLENNLSFIVENNMKFTVYFINNIRMYKNEKYEFMCITDTFDCKHDLMFLKNVADIVITNNGILLGYNFAGHNMFNLQQQLYDNYYNNIELRQLFLNHILFDITYGQFELSCFPDLNDINQQPDIVIENGEYKIINICCYHLDKNIELIIDTIINSKINLSKQIKIYLKNIIYKLNNEIYIKFRQYRENETEIDQYLKLVTYLRDLYKNIAILLGIDFNVDDFLLSIQINDKYQCFDDINKLIMTKISNEFF